MSLVNGYTITLLCAVLCECMSSEVSVSPLVRGGAARYQGRRTVWCHFPVQNPFSGKVQNKITDP